VYNAFRNHKQLASFDHLRGFSFDIHDHFALEDVEEIVRGLMLVKWVFPFKFDDHDIVVVVIGHDVRVPMARKQSQLLGNIDWFHRDILSAVRPQLSVKVT
jgi:hypothetical protein